MAVLDEMKNLENQKKEFMAQLGEVYYKNCKADGADVPGEAAGIIAKIDETDRQMKLLIEPETVRAGEQEPPVEEAEEVQSEYQGSVCPKCGAPVEPDQIFCVNCGTKLEEEAAEQTEIISDILNDIQSEEREKAAAKERKIRAFASSVGQNWKKQGQALHIRRSRSARQDRGSARTVGRCFRRRCVFVHPAGQK